MLNIQELRKATREVVGRKPVVVQIERHGMFLYLEIVQQRIRAAAQDERFLIAVAESAKELLLSEGTDMRYGARPLKRAIERLLVHPLSNLPASRQIGRGDYIRVSHPQDGPSLQFSRETQAEHCHENDAKRIVDHITRHGSFCFIYNPKFATTNNM